MVDTVRTIAQLLANMPVGVTDGTSCQDIRDMLVTLAPAHAEFSDTTSQSIAIINTPQVVTFDTEYGLDGFTHSVGEITLTRDIAALDITWVAEAANGSGANTLSAWIEVDTGAGFVNLANSGEEIILSSNDEDILTLDRHVIGLTTGDKVRIRMQGTSTNLLLEAHAASGAVPAIPSSILHFTHI